MPLVSVVVVTYNDADYIIETLNSIKSQSYRNIELIVSDDGSKDETIELTNKWFEENSNCFAKIQLLTVVKNTGVTGNFLRAEKAATGEWLKTIGGDDILLPNCIQENINYVLANPGVEVVVSRQQLIDDNGKSLPLSKKSRDFYNFYESSNEVQQQYILRFDPIEDTCLFKSKAMMESINYYDLDFPMQEDSPLKVRIAFGGYKYWLIDKVLLSKRMRAGSLSGISDPKIIVNNDIVRKEINKKYYLPKLHGLEKAFMIYDGNLVNFFYHHSAINKKNTICKLFLRILRLPVILIKKLMIKEITKHYFTKNQ